MITQEQLAHLSLDELTTLSTLVDAAKKRAKEKEESDRLAKSFDALSYDDSTFNRDRLMLADHEAGMTYAQIGEKYGLSRHYVPLRVSKAKRSKGVSEPTALPERIDQTFCNTRTRHALLQRGVTTWQEVSKFSKKTIVGGPNFGKKSLAEVIHQLKLRSLSLTTDDDAAEQHALALLQKSYSSSRTASTR